LLKADIRFILVGGLAEAIQGSPIMTYDVDILYDPSSDNVDKLFELLKSIDATYRRPDDKIIQPKREDFLEEGHLLFTTRLGPLDVLAFIEEGKTYTELLEHTTEIEFKGRTLCVLDLDAIVELKKTSKDLKDKQKLPILEEMLKQIKKD
jgi:hypothetical protein